MDWLKAKIFWFRCRHEWLLPAKSTFGGRTYYQSKTVYYPVSDYKHLIGVDFGYDGGYHKISLDKKFGKVTELQIVGDSLIARNAKGNYRTIKATKDSGGNK